MWRHRGKIKPSGKWIIYFTLPQQRLQGKLANRKKAQLLARRSNDLTIFAQVGIANDQANFYEKLKMCWEIYDFVSRTLNIWVYIPKTIG